MTPGMNKRWLFLCVPAVAVLAIGCRFNSNIRLHNTTNKVLTPYPVKSEPPPPHREADPAGDVAINGDSTIDPEGFNPVYYASGVSSLSQANGVYIGLQMDEPPYMIQYKVFHYKVEPGQAGHDPAVQPILLHTGVEEVENVNQKIVVNSFFGVGDPVPPGGWEVRIRPD